MSNFAVFFFLMNSCLAKNCSHSFMMIAGQSRRLEVVNRESVVAGQNGLGQTIHRSDTAPGELFGGILFVIGT